MGHPLPSGLDAFYLARFSPFLEEVMTRVEGSREIIPPATHTSETESWSNSLRRACEYSRQTTHLPTTSMPGLELEHQFTKSSLQTRCCQGVYKVKTISTVILRHRLPLFTLLACVLIVQKLTWQNCWWFSMNQGSGTKVLVIGFFTITHMKIKKKWFP